MRDAVGAESLSIPLKGVFARAEPFPFAPAFKNGEAVLLMTGGVCVLEGGLLGFLMEGLSHEEKKSSAGSPEGVEAPSRKVGERMSVIATSSGNLCCGKPVTRYHLEQHPLFGVRCSTFLQLIFVLGGRS